MKRLSSSAWRIALSTFLIFGLLSPAVSASASQVPANINRLLAASCTPTIDGALDACYGAPLATDNLGDMTEANLDLHNLYITHDSNNIYIAFDAYVSGSYGMAYGIYIDTNQVNGSGGATDPWSRNVNAVSGHLPEYALYIWHDSDPIGNAELSTWSGSGWSSPTLISQGGAQAFSSTNHLIEYKIPRSALNNPSKISVEAFTTGGSGHAQDSVPSDPNVNYSSPDWGGTVTTLSSFVDHSLTQLSLVVTNPAGNLNTHSSDLTVTGTVLPSAGSVVTITLNTTNKFYPTIGGDGSFSEPVSLKDGPNTLEVKAANGAETITKNYTVTFGASHDNNIWWTDLGHNSRDTLFRTPGGPVVTGASVKLRLRAARGDLTAAKLRLYNDRTNAESFQNMTLVLQDGIYEWWEATVNVGPDPTVYWYRFIAIDGTNTAFYEDDETRTGGWGKTFASSPDNSWQLTVYDPAFKTPDWVKNAVFYQIFPDRFRDGDTSNDVPAGTFFYDETGGTVARSLGTDWNTVVCDPREATSPCAGTYSKNFYGGDLQGLIDELDGGYFTDLGITAIYLNPIFESPSNHKYDATDYSVIDPAFGDETLFQSLMDKAHARGIKVILDGVFNHTSSDSIYFDRYGRYSEVGACESNTSPYRDWYYFQDVKAGTGPCVGSDGTPNAAKYTSWFGYDSLPKLNSSNSQVRALIWDGAQSIARKWITLGADGFRLDVAGDVDPGVTGDPTNNYWEGFRASLHSVNPNAYIVGEEWGNASSWLLGNEWDATMNYQFGSALASFWRDTPFADNDHNSGSSAGTLSPLTPAQLDERLKNLQERYAPEAFLAMMNLVDSHDMNRILFQLDENPCQQNVTGANCPSNPNNIYKNPAYDWSSAINKLKGLVLLQMTLPGAPTVYYGDEAGLVGPAAWDGTQWQDDPYNRQPFPWLDQSGTPYYQHLQTQASQDALRNYYKMLIAARNAHAALRTGSFDTLLVDNTNKLYGYGRLMSDYSDAAVILVNRSASDAPVELDVSGYIGAGAVFTDVMHSGAVYTVAADGKIRLSVPTNSGVLLVYESGSLTPPSAPVLDKTEGETSVDLSWSDTADTFYVYRSRLSGGGYTKVATTTLPAYTDSGLTPGQTYYYVVVASDDTTLLRSASSNEVSAIPHYVISWANTKFPTEITHTIGITPTVNIYGRVLIDGITSEPGQTPGLIAKLGFGPVGSDVSTWNHWVNAGYSGQAGTNDADDEFAANLVPEELGDFDYKYCYSTTNGREWTCYNTDGGAPGKLHVLPANDTTPPAVPQNLAVTDWGASFIKLGWDPIVNDPSLYAYDLFRSTDINTLGTQIARTLAPTTTYTDTAVVTGLTYYYKVKSVDRNFNKSEPSNQAEGTATPKLVEVTFQVLVPSYTPAGDTIYIVGNIPELGAWNPSLIQMSKIGVNLWEKVVNIMDGTKVQYKYTRGDSGWNNNEWWGSIISTNNRNVTIAYGTTGKQTVSDTALNYGVGTDDHKAIKDWRDPLVTGITPVDGTAGVSLTPNIQVTWNHTMTLNTQFTLTGPHGVVAGAFNNVLPTFRTTFTPGNLLEGSTPYTITVFGQKDAAGISMFADYTSTFVTDKSTAALQAAAYSIGEARGFVTITATLNTPSAIPVTITVATANGTALAGKDYTALTRQIVFAPGETSKRFTVAILDNYVKGTDRTFNVILSAPANAYLGALTTATVTILEDDPYRVFMPNILSKTKP